MTKYKFFAALSSIVAIGTPVATVISCGDVESSKILQVAIRTGQKPLYNKIKVQWEKANPDYKLKWREINSDLGLGGTFDTWKASNSVPEIMLLETSWANIYQEKGWIVPMDLKDIATNQKYRINNDLVDEIWQQTDITKANFSSQFSDMINDSKIAENKWNHFPFAIGPEIAYMWTKGKNKSGNTVNLLDGQHNLEWYVPNDKQANQVNIDKVTFGGSSPSTSPLYNPEDNQPYKNTLQDIKDFITNSARKDQVKFNGDLSSSGPRQKVIATGYYGQTQRFISVLLTLKKAFNLDMTPMDGQFVIPFIGLIQGESALATSGESNANANNVLNDDKIFTTEGTRGTSDYKINTNSKPTGKEKLSKLKKQIWYGKAGYYQDGAVKIPKAIDATYTGPGDGMGAGKSLGLGTGGAWMYVWKFGYERPAAEKPKGTKEFGLQALQSIALPFGVAVTDGFSITAGLSSEKLAIAKNFIRFLMQKQVQLVLCGTSVLASRISALDAQKPLYPAALLPITQSGNLIKKIHNDNTYQTYMNVIYNNGEKSTKNLYKQYNESFYNKVAQEELNLKVDPENKFDIGVYVKIIQKTIDDFNQKKRQS